MATSELVKAQDGFGLPPLNREEGSSFGFFDRLIFGWRDGKVFDYGDWEARDIYEMMSKDYRARQIENVLTLPILSAERRIAPVDGDKGDAEWLENFWKQDHLNGGCETTLDEIVDLSTTGIIYKKAFFEKVWVKGVGDFAGQTVYGKLGWRPQTTCRLMRDPKNGSFQGFEQEPFYVGPEITPGKWPIQIPAKRAFVYIHNRRRDPLNGSSDMEIAYWCWKTKQKILFLWFQFLENVSLPRIVVRGPDQAVANSIAQQVAKLKGSGILPIVADSSRAGEYSIDPLDVSGKGADQFTAAIRWLDNAAADAVLAGFLNLTGGTGNDGKAGGSLALSKDASDFFLQMEEAKTRELAHSIRRDVFAPLVRLNRGPTAAVPKLEFEPLNDEDKSTSVELLTQVLARPTAQGQPAPIPQEFVEELAEQVADFIGLDGKKVAKSFEKAAKDAQDRAAQQSATGASPAGQGAAAIAGATDAAGNVLKQLGQRQPPAQPAQ